MESLKIKIFGAMILTYFDKEIENDFIGFSFP